MSQLERHATEFLARQGIRDKPLSWQPPTDTVRDLELPGCDLRDIDPGVLHRLIRHECLTTAQAARRLDVSHDAVRFVLQEQPAPPGAAKSAKWGRGGAVRRARLDDGRVWHAAHDAGLAGSRQAALACGGRRAAAEGSRGPRWRG